MTALDFPSTTADRVSDTQLPDKPAKAMERIAKYHQYAAENISFTRGGRVVLV